MTRRHPVPVPMPGERRPSATRSVSLRSVRYVQELRKGNASALKHGVFATVHNAPDVATETALLYVSHPYLDPIADHRLVEQCAVALVHYARATLALEDGRYLAPIVAAARDFGNRAERLERAVHERDVERRKANAGTAAPDPKAYARPRAVG